MSEWCGRQIESRASYAWTEGSSLPLLLLYLITCIFFICVCVCSSIFCLVHICLNFINNRCTLLKVFHDRHCFIYIYILIESSLFAEVMLEYLSLSLTYSFVLFVDILSRWSQLLNGGDRHLATTKLRKAFFCFSVSWLGLRFLIFLLRTVFFWPKYYIFLLWGLILNLGKFAFYNWFYKCWVFDMLN